VAQEIALETPFKRVRSMSGADNTLWWQTILLDSWHNILIYERGCSRTFLSLDVEVFDFRPLVLLEALGFASVPRRCVRSSISVASSLVATRPVDSETSKRRGAWGNP
jgi:hypothetical protein